MKFDLEIPSHMELLLTTVIDRLGSRPECFIHSGTDFTSLKITWKSQAYRAKAKTETKRKKRRGGEISRSPNPVPAPDVAAAPKEKAGEEERTPPASAPAISDAQAPPKKERKKKSPSRYTRDQRRYREWRQRPRCGQQPRDAVADPPVLQAKPDPPAKPPRDVTPAPGLLPTPAVLDNNNSNSDDYHHNGVRRCDTMFRIWNPPVRREFNCRTCNNRSHKWVIGVHRVVEEGQGHLALVFPCHHAVSELWLSDYTYCRHYRNSVSRQDLTHTDRTWALNFYEELCDILEEASTPMEAQ